jgi:hypothetical protein
MRARKGVAIVAALSAAFIVMIVQQGSYSLAHVSFQQQILSVAIDDTPETEPWCPCSARPIGTTVFCSDVWLSV